MWLSRGEQPREHNDGTLERKTKKEVKKEVGVKRLSSSLPNKKAPDAPVSFRAWGRFSLYLLTSGAPRRDRPRASSFPPPR